MKLRASRGTLGICIRVERKDRSLRELAAS